MESGTATRQTLRCLLLISADGERDEARIAAGESPRRDYLELARRLNADVVDAARARPRIPTLLRRFALGRDIAIVLSAMPRLRDFDVVFVDNERTGLLLAALSRARRSAPRLAVIGHHLTPRKKHALLRFVRSRIGTLIVHSETQRRFAIDELGYASYQVVTLPYQVDTGFWGDAPAVEQRDMVCTAGLEYRDYDTLLAASEGLGVSLEIGASSNWSSKRSTLAGKSLPSWVTVRSYGYLELRELYARARFVVVPLLDNSFQAGITTLLEAMAAGRTPVVSRTAGQAGVLRGPLWQASDVAWPVDSPPVDESTGIYFLPGDVGGLRSAMRFLLRQPYVCELIGRNAQALVREQYTVELYAERFARVIATGRLDAPG